MVFCLGCFVTIVRTLPELSTGQGVPALLTPAVQDVYYVYTTYTEATVGDQLVIRIDRKTKEKFYELARMEGKTASEKVREMVESYIRTMDIGPVVDDLWERIGSKMNEKGVGEDDVGKAIKDVRASR